MDLREAIDRPIPTITIVAPPLLIFAGGLLLATSAAVRPQISVALRLEISGVVLPTTTEVDRPWIIAAHLQVITEEAYLLAILVVLQEHTGLEWGDLEVEACEVNPEILEILILEAHHRI